MDNKSNHQLLDDLAASLAGAMFPETRRAAAYHGRTFFIPLPELLRDSGATDNKCCCPYCSADPHEAGETRLVGGIWDTLAVCVDTGKTWRVHYPELHGIKPLR